MQKSNSGYSYHYCGFMHYSEKSHEISSSDPRVLSFIKVRIFFFLKWYVDAEFALHLDFELHTGTTWTMVKGYIVSMSRKQKLGTSSSRKAYLVGADEASSLILYTKLFL